MLQSAAVIILLDAPMVSRWELTKPLIGSLVSDSATCPRFISTFPTQS